MQEHEFPRNRTEKEGASGLFLTLVTRKPGTCRRAGEVSKGEPHLPTPGVRRGQEGGGGWCPAGFGDRGLRGQQTWVLEARAGNHGPAVPPGQVLVLQDLPRLGARQHLPR